MHEKFRFWGVEGAGRKSKLLTPVSAAVWGVRAASRTQTKGHHVTDTSRPLLVKTDR